MRYVGNFLFFERLIYYVILCLGVNRLSGFVKYMLNNACGLAGMANTY